MLPMVQFKIMSYDCYIETLSWMIMVTDGPNNLSDRTFKLYPFLCGKINNNMNFKTIREILTKEMTSYYESEVSNMERHIEKYQELWKHYNDEYMRKMIDSLEVDIKGPYEFKAFIGPKLPAFPRDIKEQSFLLSTNLKNITLIDIIAHECCHFLFFEKWKQLFNDWSYEQFIRPSIIWYLSEIVIDPILNTNEFKNLFSYIFKSYSVFYDIEINGHLLMDYIKDIYETNKIDDAIKLSYEYVLTNETEIKNLAK